MAWNTYKRLLGIIDRDALDVGTVLAVQDDGCLIQTQTGAQIRVQGTAAPGDIVYHRGGVITGPAPDLPGTLIEI